jgi:hypothetical protein
MLLRHRLPPRRLRPPSELRARPRTPWHAASEAAKDIIHVIGAGPAHAPHAAPAARLPQELSEDVLRVLEMEAAGPAWTAGASCREVERPRAARAAGHAAEAREATWHAASAGTGAGAGVGLAGLRGRGPAA